MKLITPTSITRHGIGLPHITLGTEKYLLISTEMYDLLELSETRGLVFVEHSGKFYIAGKELPDAFKCTKYPQKYNYVTQSSTLAFWLREKFGYHKLVMIAKGRPKTIDGLRCYPLHVKEGVQRRSAGRMYAKMKETAHEAPPTE